MRPQTPWDQLAQPEQVILGNYSAYFRLAVRAFSSLHCLRSGESGSPLAKLFKHLINVWNRLDNRGLSLAVENCPVQPAPPIYINKYVHPAPAYNDARIVTIASALKCFIAYRLSRFGFLCQRSPTMSSVDHRTYRQYNKKPKKIMNEIPFIRIAPSTTPHLEKVRDAIGFASSSRPYRYTPTPVSTPSST